MTTENEQKDQAQPEEKLEFGKKTKIGKAFDETMVKLNALAGGEANVPGPDKPKFSAQELGGVMARVLEKKKLQLQAEVDKGAEDLLDEMVKYKQEERKAMQEYMKEDDKRKKGFIDKAEALFKRIEGFDVTVNEYRQTINETRQ